MSHVHFSNPEVLARLRSEYEQKIERGRAALKELQDYERRVAVFNYKMQTEVIEPVEERKKHQLVGDLL